MKSRISEEFLCYLWKFQLFNLPLVTSEGQKLIVKYPGIKNTDGGPDFSNAIIQIDKTIWAGDVEIHFKSSDWDQHKHSINKKYNTVVLHIVYDNDMNIKHSDRSLIPTLQIRDKFHPSLLEKYQRFLNARNWIACENQIQSVSEIKRTHFLSRLAVERLERKTLLLYDQLTKNKNDFDDLYYKLLSKCFGFKTNSQSFEILAQSLPYNILKKHSDKLIEIEALLFGQAGMLNKTFSEEYPKNLKKEYEFLKHKYSLHPILGQIWKYLRLRPINFPDLRIAQFAQMIHQNKSLFAQTIESKYVNDVSKLFDLKASEYWNTHYKFEKISKKQIKFMGQSAINSILINASIPVIFVFGKHIDDHRLTQKALNFLNLIDAEKNKIISNWNKIGISAHSAFFSQALLELKNQYCDYKRCLDCEIGHDLLNRNQN